MMSVFSYYGKDEVVKDIIRFCVNNPQNLDFGDKLDISYRKLEYGCGWVCVSINFNHYWDLKDFALTAKLVREV